VAHGDRGQPLVLGLTEDRAGPFTQLLDGLTAGRVVALIHRRQQADIFGGVLVLETSHGALAAL
jgi:hypothetical protein